MICLIDATVGGTVTDVKAQAINWLNAVAAITTATAGATLSVPSLTAPTATPAGANVITSTLSNAEGGGWTNSPSSNILNNYNASFGSPYQLDLYMSSGKASYPFRKLSFRTNPAYTFSGAYATYPDILISHGFNTTTNASGNYLLATSIGAAPPSNGTPNQYKCEVNYGSGTADLLTQPSAGQWLIASTARYFIAISGGLGSTGLPGTVIYVGLRSTQLWEDQYDDNPPLCSFLYHGGNAYGTAIGSNATMFARTQQSTGQVNTLPNWFAMNVRSSLAGAGFIDPLSGYNGASTPLSTVAGDPTYFWGNEIQIPLCLSSPGMFKSKNRASSVVTPPVSDPITGTLVPPAYPIQFARNTTNSFNAGGQIFGLYKSLGGTDSYMQQFYTPGQTVLVNGENYYCYAIGDTAASRDLFLVRKY